VNERPEGRPCGIVRSTPSPAGDRTVSEIACPRRTDDAIIHLVRSRPQRRFGRSPYAAWRRSPASTGGIEREDQMELGDRPDHWSGGGSSSDASAQGRTRAGADAVVNYRLDSSVGAEGAPWLGR